MSFPDPAVAFKLQSKATWDIECLQIRAPLWFTELKIEAPVETWSHFGMYTFTKDPKGIELLKLKLVTNVIY